MVAAKPDAEQAERELATAVARFLEVQASPQAGAAVVSPPGRGHWIQLAVCQRYDVTLAEMLSVRRNKRLAFARHVAVWLAWKSTGMSTVALGRLFGNRDHTTVMHAIARIEALTARDPAFADEMDALLLAVTTGDPT
jgi:Bacterial dnaA protein helix-turn-helix